MKTAKAILAAALAAVLTGIFVVFPGFYYDRNIQNDELSIRSIGIEENETSETLADSELFGALYNGISSQSIGMFQKVSNEKKPVYFDTARTLAKEILFRNSQSAYSEFLTSYYYGNVEYYKLQYVTVSNSELLSFDFIIVTMGECTVCFEEKSGTAIFCFVWGVLKELIEYSAENYDQVFNSAWGYYKEHGLIDLFMTIGYLPDEQFDEMKYLDLIVYETSSNEFVYGYYEFLMRVDELRDQFVYYF